MFRLPYLALCVFILKLDLFQASQDFIVGGHNVLITDYPYQVSLHKFSGFYCGGSLLAPKVILTAAHCTHNLKPENITVRAGSSFARKEGQMQTGHTIHHPPQYKFKGADYDVSILLVEEPFQLSGSIRPIQLVSKSVPLGTLATVTGWGLLRDSGPEPDQLQALAVAKLDHTLCSTLYPHKISPRMTCYGYLEGKRDSCQGDSGGPLAIGNVQVGIVSWGYGCAQPNEPGVYTDLFNEDIVHFLKEFI